MNAAFNKWQDWLKIVYAIGTTISSVQADFTGEIIDFSTATSELGLRYDYAHVRWLKDGVNFIQICNTTDLIAERWFPIAWKDI